MILQNAAAQREAKAQFDTSRLVDLSEQVLLDCPAAQVCHYILDVLHMSSFWLNTFCFGFSFYSMYFQGRLEKVLAT